MLGLPEKYRRLWRRRLRRRPLLPVLAFALAVVNGVFAFLVHYQLGRSSFWSVVLGCGVAELGLASAWITTSWRLVWIRLVTVILLLAMIVAAAHPWHIFSQRDRWMYWATTLVMCLLIIGVTSFLLWLIPVVVERIRRAVRLIAAMWTCPHCGKSYGIADEGILGATRRRLRLKLLGLLGLTTVVAILSAIGSTAEWRQIYGGLEGAITFFALCITFPVIAVTNYHTESKLWRGVVTLTTAAAASMVIDFPLERLQGFVFCASIGIASQIGIWLASPRPAVARKRVPVKPCDVAAAGLPELG